MPDLRLGLVAGVVAALALVCGGSGQAAGHAATSSKPAPWFAGPRTQGLRDFADSVAIGDLNGDGALDIAATNDDWSVSVLLNAGNGHLRFVRNYRAQVEAFGIAIGDLNADGKPDLVTGSTAEDGNKVAVLINRGDGSFQARRTYRVGTTPWSVAIGDLNADGAPDIATADCPTSGAGTVSVLLNHGGGSFGTRTYRAGVCPDSVAISDLTSDGLPDLAVANSNTISVFVNAGGGSFASKRDYRSTGAREVAIADLDGDGKPELIGSTRDEVDVFHNAGNGALGTRRIYKAAGGHLAVGDLNGDGSPELVTWDEFSSQFTVLTNRGDGSFTAPASWDQGGGEGKNLALGDLNGDGKPDLATAGPVGNVAIVTNATGFCGVPSVGRETLAAATRKLRRAHCRVGAVRTVHSKRIKRGRVVTTLPRGSLGALLPIGSKVALLVSSK